MYLEKGHQCLCFGASPRVSFESDTLDRLITQNRSNLADEFGGKSPNVIFKAFLDWNRQSLLDLLVNETNRYAKEVRNDPSFHVDHDEMKVFIGILLLSGYHRLPGAPLYWNTNVDITCNIATNAMSNTRFQTVKKYIHCCNNSNLDVSDKFAKIRPLYDITKSRLRSFGQMHANLSIDEKMIPYTGMHSAKQRMKDKSIRFGYKNFVHAGPDGFSYHIVPYVGAKGVAGDPGKDLTSRITLQFVKWDGGASLHFVQMLYFVLSLIAMSQVTLGIGSLSKVASVLLAPLLARESAFSFPK